MEYTVEEILSCLENRKAWYQKAIHMQMGKIAYENGFDFPDGSVVEWRGSVRELYNMINILKKCIAK